MVKSHEQTKLQKFIEALSKFLSKSWKAIIIVLVAAVVIISGLGIISTFKTKKIEASAQVMSELEEKYQTSWVSAEDEEIKAVVGKEIKAEAESILETYPDFYAAQKALLLMGNISYEEKLWSEASDSFLKLAADFPESFLAPLALMYAASALEEDGKTEDARDTYKRVVDDYPDVKQEVLRARFNVGRLEETLGNTESAREMYESIIDADTQDPWALLAQSRLLIISDK